MKLRIIYILASVLLNCFPCILSGQKPDLGISAGFALFTSSGAFGNVGTTNVTGNIGTNLGSFTGLSPIVNGQVYLADSVSAQAAINVGLAYTFLSTLTSDTIIGNILGNNQVLTSDVYSLGLSASTLNGNLILDGQGDSSALFVFQIGGAFSTSAHSEITLINSASRCNVFWQINGAVVLGDSSVFKGTIIANGSISLLDSVTLFGRGLSIAGAISIDNNNINPELTQEIILPIELLSFIAQPAAANVHVSWATASESNNNYFTVQRSTDAVIFVDLIEVNSLGNSSITQYYSAMDDQPIEGISYYRLKQTDFDGKFTLSNLALVDFEKAAGISIYPNPFSTYTTIALNKSIQAPNIKFELFNCAGEEVMNAIINQQVTILETGILPSGVYTYKINSNTKTIQSGSLVSGK